MTACCALGCKNRTGKSENSITFHKFPRDPVLKKQWVSAVCRKNWLPKKTSLLCSAHFSERDIDRTSLCVVRIKEGKIPSIFSAISNDSIKSQDEIKFDSLSDTDSSSGSCQTSDFDEDSDNENLAPIDLQNTLNGPKDEFSKFGEFVAHELRCINSPALKIKLKKSIQDLIMEIATEDEN